MQDLWRAFVVDPYYLQASVDGPLNEDGNIGQTDPRSDGRSTLESRVRRKARGVLRGDRPVSHYAKSSATIRGSDGGRRFG